MSTEANRRTVRLIFEEVLGKRRLDLIEELIDPDLLDHNTHRRDGSRGRESFRRHAHFFHVVLGDCEVSVDDLIVDGDRAVAFRSARGTHRGSLWGVAPTGRSVVATTTSLFRFRNGMVVEYEARPDRLGLLLQLGGLGDYATAFDRIG